ncbi:RNA polymerase sigma factor [Streptomyces sp. NPDC057197]|uniref:RNA polymerase sigma factor n=1 Tax=Streptomyces sp. NPDC057197 TaxID=3346045 RepID=UPI0036250CC5
MASVAGRDWITQTTGTYVVVSECAGTGTEDGEFQFENEEHYQGTRRKIVSALRQRISEWDRYFSEDALFEITDEAISQCVLSGQLKADKGPVAYMTIRAVWGAMAVLRRWEPVDLVETVEMNLCPDSEHAQHGHPLAWQSPAQEASEDSLAVCGKALRDLPATQFRQVMELRIQGLSNREVAQSLGIPLNQVHQQWKRGVSRLRSHADVQDRTRARYTRRRGDSPGTVDRQDRNDDRSEE